MTESEKAVLRRKTLTKRLELIEQSINSTTTTEEAESRISALNDVWDQFQKAQETIEEVYVISPADNDDDLDAQIEIRNNFENKFHIVKAKILKIRKSEATISQPATPSTNYQYRQRFPEISLPTFSGKVEEFPAFIDLFDSTVDSDTTLPNVQKLIYLKSTLKGEAFELVKSLPTTNENYLPARKLMIERYRNKKILINAYIRNLINVKPAEDTPSDLKRILDHFRNNINGLRQCDEQVDYWNSIIIYLLTSKLSPKTKEEWELKSSPSEIDPFPIIVTFLENRIRALTVSHQFTPNKSPSTNPVRTKMPTIKANIAATSEKTHETTPTCDFCQQAHLNIRCPKIVGKEPKEILALVREINACRNCLRKQNHSSFNCPVKSRCKKCGKPHHTLLHDDSLSHSTKASPVDEPESTPTEKDDNTLVANLAKLKSKAGLLATIALIAFDSTGNVHNIRALLDPGAQSCFVTPKLASRLKLPLEETYTAIMGIDSLKSESEYSVGIKIATTTLDFKCDLNAVVLNKPIPNLPTKSIEYVAKKVSHLKLADPLFYKPLPVDLIIDVKLFPKILRPGIFEGNSNEPGRINSIFGWLICGEIPTFTSQHSYNNPIVSHLAINELLEKFWKIEDVESPLISSPHDQIVETHYIENVSRLPNGRFVVRLPVSKNPADVLGESRAVAARILTSTFRRLNAEQKTQYSSFMNEYIQLGHMSRIPIENVNAKPHCYLPHHAVYKKSTTSSIRVVFNASKKTSTNLSLNDILHVGPVVQQELIEIMLRFRFHAIGICSDAEKMYRQVLVAPQDRSLQRILWFDDNDQIIDYELNTVTYGTACASFLATRTLKEIALREAENFPTAAKIATRDFYVDDLISGADSISEASTLAFELDALMKKGGFNLRKWTTNCPEALSNLKTSEDEATSFLFNFEPESNALGMRWSVVEDVFIFHVELPPITKIVSKRNILSESSRLFDPFGLLAPVIVRAKILLQSLWLSGVDWDSEIPPEILSLWTILRKELCFYKFKIPRRVTLNSTTFEMHGFCDASVSAYAACLYIRSCDSNGKVLVRLLCAKTRVAPLKTVSIPRLELCGALLLSQLLAKVLKAIIHSPSSIHLWTDSKTTLTWIKKTPSTWKTFVANRVSAIHENTSPEMWRHVPGTLNPADIPSRGVLPSKLDNSLWFNGPSFLSQPDPVCYPEYTHVDEPQSFHEARREKVVCSATVTDTDSIILKYSKLRTLVNVVAYCLRCSQPKIKRPPSKLLSPEETENALLCLAKIVQGEAFSTDIEKLLKKNAVGKRSPLRLLTPFLDDKRILRVGGLIEHANLPFEERHPIILPPNNFLTTLIIRETHVNLCHGTFDAVLAAIRSRFWIVNGKSAIKSLLNKCVICIIRSKRTCSQLMGNLPIHRVTPTHAFLHVGIDLGGPFEIRNSISNSRSFVKSYFVIFVCTQTKACHLELICSLSTNAFLVALSNFVSRRGLPAVCYSDNGTNMVGADAELRKLYQAIEPACASRSISWKFIPPRAPHMGGLWEANVKLVKRHLFSTIKSTRSLTYEELSSFLIRVEASINSRPLCALSDDPNDVTILTPAHFLIGRSPSSLPNPKIEIPMESVRSSFKLLQKAIQVFWKKWSTDYLRSLQNRPKWQVKRTNLKINDLVVIIDDNPLIDTWHLGRIVETHPGADNLVRVCTVRTSRGTFRRSVTKLVYIPVDDENKSTIN